MNYNEKLMKETILAFTQKHYKPEDITIYFDLDNTLCLFSVYKKDEEALLKMYSQGFYRNLMCFTEAPFVISTLQKMGFNVKILSACIETPYAKSEKLDWIHFHIPSIKNDDVILVSIGANKSSYIENIEKAILVDDFGPNLKDWYEAGGIGIKKSYSGKVRPIPQITNLIEIFQILFELNCYTK